ncbi:hypothetical protein FTO90_08735 [Listeria monocytogenes]|nr:hypothetical protein [Listeria monocytogenes]
MKAVTITNFTCTFFVPPSNRETALFTSASVSVCSSSSCPCSCSSCSSCSSSCSSCPCSSSSCSCSSCSLLVAISDLESSVENCISSPSVESTFKIFCSSSASSTVSISKVNLILCTPSFLLI